MATSFKTLLTDDIQTTRTNLHEAIPLTGSILSGTYSELNIKNYTHGMFQSVFDYPYLSSSANHILDITTGFSTASFVSSTYASSVDAAQFEQKVQMYNELAQVLVGNNASGNVELFDEDGNFNTLGDKMGSCFFVNLARLLTKDEIKKGSFELKLNVGPIPASDITSSAIAFEAIVTDSSGNNGYKVNSPAGEYGILFASGSASTNYGLVMAASTPQPCGLLFYQAGIAVLSGSLFNVAASGGLLKNAVVDGSGTAGLINMDVNGDLTTPEIGVTSLFVSSTISQSCDSLRARINNLSFNNTTELNSTVYFCRANANEFNYSSNPTYLSQSQIRTKQVRADEPVSYATTVGLYGETNELLAVAKLSEPLKKTPSNEFTLRVRLDY